MTSIHIDGPFGGCDKQAENDAFEQMVGGPRRAFQLRNIFVEAGRSRETAMRIAKREGYTLEQIKAWEHLG